MRSTLCFTPEPHLAMSIRARTRRLRESTVPSSQKQNPSHPAGDVSVSTLELWQASRRINSANNSDSPTGTRRAFTSENVSLAWQILRLLLYTPQLVFLCTGGRVFDVVVLSVVYIARGLLPASRAFSHARILDELQQILVSAGTRGSWHSLGWFLGAELLRTIVEQAVDLVTASKEAQIRRRVRLHMEEIQMQTRLRLDIVSLADPDIRDLLHESDLFINSFSSPLGLLSPLDLLSALTTVADAAAQCFLLWKLTDIAAWTLQPILLVLALLPTLLNVSNYFVGSGASWISDGSTIPNHSERAERMRTLAFSDHYQWRLARAQLLHAEESDSTTPTRSSFVQSFLHNGTSEVLCLIQNVALAPQMSGVSLGLITIWRSTFSVLLQSFTNAARSFDSAFQTIFLAAAFSAALHKQKQYSTAESATGNRGMRIEARNLSFTYQNAREPALRDVNIRIEPGEFVAIVGYLLINDHDIRRYNPRDLHAHTTALFQQFARFSNSTLRENTGFGRVDMLDSTEEIATALDRAGAASLVADCPDGIETKLDFSAFEAPQPFGLKSNGLHGRRALSGGEWQRVAIARCLMRAENCDLLLLDEASSALDARAQRELFERIEDISRGPDGRRRMTVIYITHRLSTIRHADKVCALL
ncbi:P-loop containing nucleoside triphosphate hydrolase protein [Auriculariales sp. MPI-PUGE-AT-0066]|nr:P-loop containing nucleoside triphosphate hydrolase protein [Auriculariales sp. MPI-PUGE-AT-0066]